MFLKLNKRCLLIFQSHKNEVNLKKYTYIEMQNRASTTKPIEIRAVEYSVLGISQNLGYISNQIWLLAEEVDKLFHDKTFANYLLKEESSGIAYPNTSCILFVNLMKLSNEKTDAGELASFLLGKTSGVNTGKAKQISDALIKSCDEFSKNKGVKKRMTVKEKWQDEAKLEGRLEGRLEGIQEGIQQATAKLTELINAGLSVEDALKEVSNVSVK